jgi:hypothetical protein
MKHVKIYYHFVGERVCRNLLNLDYVPTEDQTVDGQQTWFDQANFLGNYNLKSNRHGSTRARIFTRKDNFFSSGVQSN